MLDRLRALWVTEPVRVVTVLAAVIVFVLAKAGVLVDEQNVGEALALVLPILLGGEAARSQVSPAVPPTSASDELLPRDVIERQ